MYWPRTKQTANAGVIFVESIVNAEGSIFHPIHQENDVGVDGFIEFVSAGEVSGRLVAVQIKAGDSYFNAKEKKFMVSVDQSHIDYWEAYTLPVIMVCYSPSLNAGVWVSIRDYIENQKYHDFVPISQIQIPLAHHFTKDTLKDVAVLAHIRADERFLIQNADNCLSSNAQKRRENFFILRSHPDGRLLKLTIFLARQFLFDEDINVSKVALYTIARGAGATRWSWNPNNVDEKERIAFAQDLCRKLKEPEIRRIMELVDYEGWSGPDGLVERALDIISCCIETALPIIQRIFDDPAQPKTRRLNALFIISEGDDEILEENIEYYKDKPMYREIFERLPEGTKQTTLNKFVPSKKS